MCPQSPTRHFLAFRSRFAAATRHFLIRGRARGRVHLCYLYFLTLTHIEHTYIFIRQQYSDAPSARRKKKGNKVCIKSVLLASLQALLACIAEYEYAPPPPPSHPTPRPPLAGPNINITNITVTTWRHFLNTSRPRHAKLYPRLSSNAPFLKKIFENPTRHFLMVGFLNARQ